MTDRLEDLLRACTVRVIGRRSAGAGFFVAPGTVMTCEHVVAGDGPLTVRWERDHREPIELTVTQPPQKVPSRGRPIPALERDYPDISLLRVDGLSDHPCVLLDEGWPEPGDAFQVFGYPSEGGVALLTPARLSYRGPHGTAPTTFVDLGSDTIKPGMSGAALLNLRTGAVCGVITASKHAERADGALAVPWAEIRADLAEVARANQEFHAADERWGAARRLSPDWTPLGGLAAATRTLPRDIASFTGRERELEALAEAARSTPAHGAVVSIHAIGGMAGVGKTVFAVRAANQLAGQFPDGQIFLPLHGHTPGQRTVEPTDALASLLQTAGISAKEIPTEVDARSRMWRDHMAGRRLLIVLDDAVGYDQVSPLLPGTAGSMVLITSRRHLTALTDAHAVDLDVLSPHDAALLFARVAARPDTRPGDPIVARLTEQCGYLPLAIGLLAGQLHHHPGWTAADLLSDLTETRNRLELMQAENVSVSAALNLSFRDLTADQQRLFRRLGVHPGTDIDRYAAAALDGTDVPTARRGLEALYDQHLLTQPTYGRFRAHDLVREHARALAADTPEESEAAGRRLVGYYLHTARLADAFLERRTAAGVPEARFDAPAHVPELRTLQKASAWMAEEITNLFAAAQFATARGWPAAAIRLSASVHGFLRGRSQFDQASAFHSTALAAARDLGDPLAEAGTLTDAGGFQRLFGNPSQAAELLTRAVAIYRDASDRLGEANALDELAAAAVRAGDYAEAENDLHRAMALYSELGDQRGEANALNHLGAMQDVIGDYQAALASQAKSLELYLEVGYLIGAANAANELGYVQRLIGDYAAAEVSQNRAIELARTTGFRSGEADALGELGAVQVATGDLTSAATTLEAAARLCRELGYRRGEAAVLISLGPVHQALGRHDLARVDLDRALSLYRAARDRLGTAKVLNTLGETSSADEAVAFHREALAVAAEIRSPEERARALEGLARHHLGRAETEPALHLLREALSEYQRVSSPRAAGVEALLANLDSPPPGGEAT